MYKSKGCEFSNIFNIDIFYRDNSFVFLKTIKNDLK